MNSSKCQWLDVKLGPNDVLGAALLSPQGAKDFITWKLTIDESGLMTQNIFLNSYPLYPGVNLTRTSQLAAWRLERLLQFAVEIDFADLDEDYDRDSDELEKRRSLSARLRALNTSTPMEHRPPLSKAIVTCSVTFACGMRSSNTLRPALRNGGRRWKSRTRSCISPG
jgi:hypothetical protein